MTNEEPGDDGQPDAGEPETGESVDGQPGGSAGNGGGSAGNGGGSADDDGNWVSDSVDEGSEEPTEFDADSGGSPGTAGGQNGGSSGGQAGGPQSGGGPEGQASPGGGEKGPDEKYCTECGSVINAKAEICPECGVRQQSAGSSGDDERLIAALLAIFLGGIGAHKFYMGKTGQGLIYLCFFWTAIPALIGIIEGVIYLSKSDEEFRQQYMQD